jgi:acetyltransferase-like isoleucine patch superfamily enzyme
MPDVKIGPNSVVGAGSVVARDVTPNSVYVGNPAQYIELYGEYLEKSKLKDTGPFKRATMKEQLI